MAGNVSVFNYDARAVREAIKLTIAPGQVFELRAVECKLRGEYKTGIYSGYFDLAHLDELVAALGKIERAAGVYYTPNALDSDLHARALNRARIVNDRREPTTSDKDVARRRWLLIDCDVKRPAGISATDAEKTAAAEMIERVHAWLVECGFPPGLICDSGNGAHAMIPVDLPADDPFCERVVKTLAREFDNDQAKIDTTVFNAARIWKLPGTMVCKGDNAVDVGRPWRMASIVRNLLLPEVVTSEVAPQLLERINAIELHAPTVHQPRQPVNPGSSATSAFERCRKYVAKMKPSESDGTGNNDCFAAACVCFRFGLEIDDAIAVMNEFNARCQPPWSERDLARKVDDARREVARDGSFGSMLDETKPEPERPKPAPRKRTRPKPPDDGRPPPDESESPEGAEGDWPVIVINPSVTPARETMAAITNALLKDGKTYSRASLPVFIGPDHELQALQGSTELLASVLNTITEFLIVTNREPTYQLLPPKFGGPWLVHPKELARLPPIAVFTKHPVFDEDGELIRPGYHADTGIFYAGPEVEPIEGIERLNVLLSGFCWKSPADRTNFIGVLLTPFFADRFVGAKPALLLNGNQPGLGKSILAQIVAILRDGKPVISASYNSNDEEFEKTLGARVRSGVTTIIVDNAKSRGKAASIDSAVLERSITDPILCYRLLGQSATIQAENSHQFIITANSPEVSRDLVTRSIVVSLHFEGNPEHRTFSLQDIEGYCLQHRDEILGELAGFVRRWHSNGKPMADVSSRFNKSGWGQIIGGILAANGEEDFLANAEEVSGEMDRTLSDFGQLVEFMVDCEQGNWTSAELVKVADDEKLFVSELADKNPRGKATVLGVIAGRFVNEKFTVRGREWFFLKETGGKVTRYSVRTNSSDSSDLGFDSGPLRTSEF